MALALWYTFVAHVLAVISAVLVLVWNINFRGGLAFEATNKLLIFNVHPVLMLIGFIILGGEAIMSYKAFPLSRELKKLMHLILHAIALVLGVVGIYFAFKYHNESGIANLYSLHSWLGLVVIILYGIQWVIGFVVFFFPGASPSIRSNTLPWHVLFGLFIFVLAVVVTELGFLEKLTFLESSGLYRFGVEAHLVNFSAIIVVLYGFFVVLTAITPAHPDNSYGYASIPDN